MYVLKVQRKDPDPYRKVTGPNPSNSADPNSSILSDPDPSKTFGSGFGKPKSRYQYVPVHI